MCSLDQLGARHNMCVALHAEPAATESLCLVAIEISMYYYYYYF